MSTTPSGYRRTMTLCSECGAPAARVHHTPRYSALSGPAPVEFPTARIRYEPCGHEVLSGDDASGEGAVVARADRDAPADGAGLVAKVGVPALDHLVPDGMRIIRRGAGFVRGGADLEPDRLRAVAAAYENEDDLPDLILWMTPEEATTMGFGPPPGAVECLVRVSWGPASEP
ncbi:hypothetical protein ACFWTE_28760 [Nocardiopsis sp. NPDC058631]|uniref:hypothetical protein n=1 Tax=Nocardiopsis sp. NPDC058631 TaxID=3346566 RepID=UPI003663B5E9